MELWWFLNNHLLLSGGHEDTWNISAIADIGMFGCIVKANACLFTI